MTQPKRKKDERADLVKIFRTMVPGDFAKVLENSIQRFIDAELNSSPSQQGRLFMKMNLTWIKKKKTMQLVAWPYIDCEKRGL